MTEKDWLAGTHIDAMTAWVGEHGTGRQLALASCAQPRRLGQFITTELAHILDLWELDGGQWAAGLRSDVRDLLAVAADLAATRRGNAEQAAGAADRAYHETRWQDDLAYPTAPLVTGAEYLRARQAAELAAAAVVAVEAVETAVFAERPGPTEQLRTVVAQVFQHQAEASAVAEFAGNWEQRADEIAERFGLHPRKKGQYAVQSQEWADRGMDMLDSLIDRRVREVTARAHRGFIRTLHDIFGNPFRPVPFDPRWKTADVLGVARAIYDDRAFERMPLLADALMDAGCDSEPILAHCREPGPHYRGCWVVDAVLGFAAGTGEVTNV